MNKSKPVCKYGATCYRKNPQHLQQYSHGSSDTDEPAEPSELEKKRTKVDSKTANQPTKKAEKKVVPEQGTGDEGRVGKKRTQGIDDFFSQSSNKESKKQKTSASTTSTADNQTVTSIGESSSSTVDDTKHLDGAEASVNDAEASGNMSSLDPRDDIKSKFLVQMPEDFYEFWEFSKNVNSKNPSEAFYSSLGLRLVGPYDVLAGKTQGVVPSAGKQPNYLRHWRYYYDPPEFLTVIRGDDKTQFHIGYFRDDPNEMPKFVGSNNAADDCCIKSHGENIFAAVSWFIDETVKQSGKSKSLTDLQTQLKQYAQAKGFSLEQRTQGIKDRDKKIVARCFHGAGIVVPIDKNGVGYRPLPETPASLRKIFKQIVEGRTPEERERSFDELTEMVTLIQFANDECDYGEGLELGLDAFCFGSDRLHGTVLGLLPLAYQLLKRREFADVITAHLADRKRGPASALNELA